MSVVLEVLKVIIPIISPLLASGGVWAYLTARHKAALSAPAAIADSQAGMVGALNDQTRMLLNESTKDRRDLKRRVDRQDAKLDKVMAEVAECNARHAECEVNVSHLRSQIAEMILAGGMATYPHGAADVSN